MAASSTKDEREEARFYNPFAQYQGAVFDPRSSSSSSSSSSSASSSSATPATLYRLPSSPEFLFPEEAGVHRRNWSENLTYYTGSGYLSGAMIGSVVGSLDGLRAADPDDTLKLRVNRVLNAGGHRARSLGNTLGILGLFYAALESGVVHLRGGGSSFPADERNNVANSAAAGLCTGILFKIASGPRAAAFAGAVGGTIAGAAVAGKHALKRYLPV